MYLDRASPIFGPRTVGRQRLVRDLNLRAIYERLAVEGPISRAGLARALELSPTSVGRIAEVLLSAGLVEEGDRMASGVGRPQTLLRARADTAVVAGVSIRSRSLRVHLADLDGHVIATERRDRSDESATALADQVAGLIGDMAATTAPGRPIATVVIGISGVWNEAERVVYAAPNLQVLEGVDARAVFDAALNDVMLDDTVLLDNDINLAAVSEHVYGAAQDVVDFFYLSLGSGVGGAAMMAGAVQRGAQGFVGELGYLPVCVAGRVGSLESFVARRPLERMARDAGVVVDGNDVFEALERNDPALAPIGEHVAGILAQALVAVVTMLDPVRIVLGGGIGRHGAPWTEAIHQQLGKYVPNVPEIVPTAIGREASLLGAVAQACSMARGVLVARAAGA